MSLKFTAITLAAGVFSSYVVNSSDLEVLVESPFCGVTPALGDESGNFGSEYPRKVVEAADEYVGRCYQNASVLLTACKVFLRPTMPYNITRIPCPFDKPLCLGNLSAVVLDTGLIDVAPTFGLNSPHQDRIRYQKKTTCSVLPLANYTETVDASEHEDEFGRKAVFPGEKWMTFKYGTFPSLSNNITLVYPKITANVSKTMTVL
jgi:hypothetical protein